MTVAQHTKGPWRWEFNSDSKGLHLVGGRPRYDLTIMDFCRWGMSGGGIRLRQPEVPGMNIMHKLHDRADWLAPFPGREHHAHWCMGVTHPDMKLIEAAPDLLAACRGLLERYIVMGCGEGIEARAAILAIAKAVGSSNAEAGHASSPGGH